VYGKILQQETARGVGRIHGEGKKNRARILWPLVNQSPTVYIGNILHTETIVKNQESAA
jgi:hypothetical protein